jgi:hypothetical protein
MNRTLITFVTGLYLAILAIPANAGNTIHVPVDYATIQAAVDAASDGDTIIVAPGTYEENINLAGKAITLRSVDPEDPNVVKATILKEHDGTVITFNSGEGSDTIIDGLTIQGIFDHEIWVHGIVIVDSGPTISRCIIRDFDRVLLITNGSPTISDTRFEYNVLMAGSGVDSMIDIGGSDVTMLRCTFEENLSADGFISVGHSSLTIEDSLFDGNSSFLSTVLSGLNQNDVVIRNTTFVNNAGGMATVTQLCCSGQMLIEDSYFGSNAAYAIYNHQSFGSSSELSIANTVICAQQTGYIHPWSGPWNDLGGNVFASECDSFHVPSEAATIQQAIDAASDGMTIIVAPGTYNEAIDFLGKAVHLRSAEGAEVTTIDATGLNASVVTCISGEGPGTVLEGFTITGGTGTYWPKGDTIGGGMYNEGASPTVIGCVFSGNTADAGGGMVNFNSSPTVIDCTFTGNTGAFSGGGMLNWDGSNPTLIDCVFEDNSANQGGGMLNSNNSSPTFSGCVFKGNSASFQGGGMWSSPNSPPQIESTLLCANTPNHLHGPWDDLGGNEFLDECPPDCAGPADLNCDGVVDVSDLLILFDNWGACANCDNCPADLNGDCVVNVSDLLILFNNWG